jgi:hypothetical protein
VTRFASERGMLVALFATSLGYAVYAAQYDFGGIRRPGVGFVPLLTAVALVIVTGGLLVRSILRHRRVPAAAVVVGAAPVSEGRVLAATGVLALFAAVHGTVGFWVSVLGVLAVLFRIAGVRSWPGTLVGALLGAVLSYVVFSVWLGGQFPEGLLR